MTESSNRRKEIFLAALDLSSPNERDAFLAQACGADEASRRQIEAMLQAHATPDSFLEKPAAFGLTVDASDGNPLAEVLSGENVGTRIGPYKLVEQIGEGGMGVVFMAEQQEPVRRMVALKIIKPGMDSGQVLARFEAERQALALMDHPNIAKVLDAGATADGRPFFVMELVKGTPITAFCDANRLSARQRLELFVPVCQAIQHAHQKGVIHRDIKPSNVLIALYDDKPVAKVIDFGIAKAAGNPLTERTLHTGFGAIVGTPEYMSPEQATFNQLDIDTRSDVYSLGVLLYELLTGTTPVDKARLKEAALLEVLRVVREEEPARPSVKLSTTAARASIAATRGTEPAKLAQLLRGELDWIVMKSLEKDRNRRYETAAGLARDVDRYLKDELVEARPPSAGYRLRKIVRKHRGTVAVASLLLLTLVVGMAGTTWGMIRALDAEREMLEWYNHAVNKTEEAVVQEGKARLAEEAARHSARDEKTARERAEEGEAKATFQTLRAETARHAIQMDVIFRAWDRDEFNTALLAFGQTPKEFRRTWEYRFLQDLWRRKVVRVEFDARNGVCKFVKLSADGKTLAAMFSTYDNKHHSVKIMDAETLQERRGLDCQGCAETIAFGPDGKFIALAQRTADPDSSYRTTVWEVESGRKLWSVKPGPAGILDPIGLAFSPNGKSLAATASTGVVLFDTATGDQKYRINEPTGIDRVAFSPDGELLVAGGRTAVKIYDTKKGLEKLVLTLTNGVATRVVSFSPDGKQVVALMSDRTQQAFAWNHSFVRVWTVETGKEKFATKPISEYYPEDTGFTKNGKAIVMVSGVRGKRDIRALDAETGAEMPVPSSLGSTTCASLSPDGRRFASNYAGFLWTVGEVPFAKYSPSGAHFPRNFSLDGKSIYDWSDTDGSDEVKVWEVETGMRKRFLRLDSQVLGRPKTRSLSSDGKRLALANPPAGFIKIIDAETGKEQFAFPTGGVGRLAFSPDGQRLIGNTVGAVKVWNAKTGLEEIALPMVDVQRFDLSPDGQKIAVGTNAGAIYVWDVRTGEKTATLKGTNSSIRKILISPDGKRVLSEHINSSEIWDARTGEKQLTLYGDGGLLLSPDGTRALLGSKMWDVATGQLVFSFPKGPAIFSPVAFSSDGRRLLAYGVNDKGQLGILEAP